MNFKFSVKILAIVALSQISLFCCAQERGSDDGVTTDDDISRSTSRQVSPQPGPSRSTSVPLSIVLPTTPPRTAIECLELMSKSPYPGVIFGKFLPEEKKAVLEMKDKINSATRIYDFMRSVEMGDIT